MSAITMYKTAIKLTDPVKDAALGIELTADDQHELVESWFALGFCTGKAHDNTPAAVDQAIHAYQQCLRLTNNQHAWAHNNIGFLFHTFKSAHERALYHYQHAVVQDPGHSLAHNNLGNLMWKHERHMSAEFHFQKAVQNAPQSSMVRCNRANFLAFQKRDWDQARNEYIAALRCNAHDANAHYNYGKSTHSHVLTIHRARNGMHVHMYMHVHEPPSLPP
jgi:tetratricopeptide (TPR) repeat protein